MSHRRATSNSLPSPYPTSFPVPQRLHSTSVLYNLHSTESVVKLTKNHAYASVLFVVFIDSVISKYLAQILIQNCSEIRHKSIQFSIFQNINLGLTAPRFNRLTEHYITSKYGTCTTKAKTTTHVSHTKYVIVLPF